MPQLPEPPYVFFDSSRAAEPGRSFLCTNPVEVLTELDGRYLELRSGRHVADPVAWLRESHDDVLAGFLGYEFGWELLDVRAEARPSRSPRLWVGRFESCESRELSWPAEGRLTAVSCRRSAEEYCDAVRRCIEDIWDGELFEVNFTARFDAQWDDEPEAFYEQLRGSSTGAWFGMVNTGSSVVASVSPEEFIRVDEDGSVTTRPIKGTRRRSADPAVDAAAAAELAGSEKDRAENVMIVDLMRNDLTRVCELGTVEVPEMCAVESFAGVHHLVSTVTGKLRNDKRPIDVLLQCFPAGSITGAPKLRAMELAADYEASARGAYTGSMFLVHPDGWLRSNVLIRTATLFPNDDGFDVEYGAGGAVVAQSEPAAEWEEAVAKAAPLMRIAADTPELS